MLSRGCFVAIIRATEYLRLIYWVIYLNAKNVVRSGKVVMYLGYRLPGKNSPKSHPKWNIPGWEKPSHYIGRGCGWVYLSRVIFLGLVLQPGLLLLLFLFILFYYKKAYLLVIFFLCGWGRFFFLDLMSLPLLLCTICGRDLMLVPHKVSFCQEMGAKSKYLSNN